MTPLTCDPANGTVVLVKINEPRPAVVVDKVENGRWLIAAGTGTPRDEKRVAVLPASREGKALQLTKPTYFYVRNVLVAERKDMGQARGRCPPELLFKLRELGMEAVKAGARTVAEEAKRAADRKGISAESSIG